MNSILKKFFADLWVLLYGLTCLSMLLLASCTLAKTRSSIRVQVSQQYDSNSVRVSGDNVSGDFLTRLLLRGQLVIRESEHTIWGNLQEGGKIFYHDTDEDQIVSALFTGYSYTWGQDDSIGLKLSARDMTQYHHSRDYLQVSAAAFMSIGLWSSLSLELLAGARHYTFKPDPVLVFDEQHVRFSNTGPITQLRLLARLGDHWDVDVFYGLGVRFFDDDAYRFIPDDSADVNQCPGEHACLLPTGSKRMDYRHSMGLGLKFSANWISDYVLVANLSYMATYNDSNSTGSTAIWNRMRAVLSVQLPLDLALHLMGTVQLSNFPDGRNLLFNLYEPDADENENSAVARLTWNFLKDFQIVLEGAIYRGAIPLGDVGTTDFSRQTLLLGLAWALPR